MRIGVVLTNFCNLLRAFRSETRGNVLFTFAIALVPTIGFIGAAVDYSRGNSTKAAMQSAVDSAALMLSKEAQSLTTAQLNTKATDIFKALFHRTDVNNVAVTPTFTDSGTGNYKLTLKAAGSVPTTFTRVLGQDHIAVDVSSQVVWGVKRLELALALDVTGSMASSNKMTELKKAAKSLLTTLKAAAKKDGDIRVAVVPFNVDVNVGPTATNINATWLDWSRWMDEPSIVTTWLAASAANVTAWSRVGPGSACPFTAAAFGFQCANGPADRSNDSTVTTIASSDTNLGLICPSRDTGAQDTATTGILTNSYHNGCYTSVEKASSLWYTVATGSSASCGSNVNCTCTGSGSSKVCKQKTYDHVWRPRPKTAWNGCVRDRNKDFDVMNSAPVFSSTTLQKTNTSGTLENYNRASNPATADAFQPFQFYDCPAAMLPLTFNWDTLNAKIDELQPVGNTNVTIGLAWGFHAVTAAGPLGNAQAPAADLDKVIILLTDGDNTQNRWSNTQADIDARTKLACDNAKAANIKLYTVRVIDGNATLLQQCATKSDMYFNVQNATQLNAVFSAIAQNLANLRIAK